MHIRFEDDYYNKSSFPYAFGILADVLIFIKNLLANLWMHF